MRDAIRDVWIRIRSRVEVYIILANRGLTIGAEFTDVVVGVKVALVRYVHLIINLNLRNIIP